MKMFSTDSMAATGSIMSSHPRAAALSRARVRLGGRGNSTINLPSLVTWPLLPQKADFSIVFNSDYRTDTLNNKQCVPLLLCEYQPYWGLDGLLEKCWRHILESQRFLAMYLYNRFMGEYHITCQWHHTDTAASERSG